MKYTLLSFSILWFVAGCGSTTAPETTDNQAEAPGKQMPETIALSRAQLQSAGITIGMAEQRAIAGTLLVNGTVAVLPDGKATVSSKIAGRIEQFFIHEGQQVQKGQALMSISATAIFDLQQAYLQAKADLIFLEKELERQKTLSSQQVGASKLYEEAQSKYFRAKGDLQTAAAKLQYLGIGLENLEQPERLQLAQTVVVRAPIGGNVTHIPVNLGASVQEGTLLCSIVGLNDLHAHLEVFARDIPRVREGQAVTIRFPNTNFQPLQTKLEYISRDLDPESKTYSLHVHLPVGKNSEYLPGMPVTAEIQTQSAVGSWALPEAAVLHDGNTAHFFVATEGAGDVIECKKVTFEPSLRGGGYVGVPEALLAGKKVVLRGANLVDGELRKGEMQE